MNMPAYSQSDDLTVLDEPFVRGLRMMAQPIYSHRVAVIAAWFLRDRVRMISGSEDGSIRIWDVPTGRENQRFTSGIGRVRALAVTGNGTAAAWGGLGHSTLIWDVERDQKELG